MRVGLIQLTSGDLPSENLPCIQDFVAEAAAGGAEFVLTPEVTNIVSGDRGWQAQHVVAEDADIILAALKQDAAELKIWILAGSLAIRGDGDDGRMANRSFLIGPDGEIRARYDKIHMFDVRISEAETFRESAAFAPGDRRVLAETPMGGIGMSVCYDLRFAHLYRDLAQAGAEILTVPSAFSPVTGQAHWEVLLRARAIETGCYVLAPAQCGDHPTHTGKRRTTHGHSLVVAPWGEVIADGGTAPGVTLADLDLAEVARARARVPSLTHDRPISGPG